MLKRLSIIATRTHEMYLPFSYPVATTERKIARLAR